MNYEETLKYIHSLGNFRLSATLCRMEKVCEMLGNPQEKFKSIHIAGTNGKGSVAVMTADILKESGLKTGLYISPFVVNFRERIEINREFISEEDLVKYSQKVIKTNVELNEFEFITAVCFLYFRDKKVDVAVVETGLGGRLDATNIIKNPLVSVITKIGLDHTAVLGETIEQITNEKCGIIKTNSVVTVPNQDKTALSVIRNKTEKLVVPKMPETVKSDSFGNEFLYDNQKYSLSLLGEHQIYNAVTAIETVKNSGFLVDVKTVKTALSKTVFPARLEVVSKNPVTVIDGAHNPDGAKALSKYLSSSGEKITAIIAMMQDKNCEEFLKTVLPFCENCIVTEIENPRCMSASDLSKIAEKYCQNTEKEANLSTAIKRAKATDLPIFIVGSLYLASEARKYYI
ncbi:MAG: bifunctional folylpolyglutamate synthase/dihydrofolate synthase [Clostridia bacterium]|nr:bifunctional folylpolyglutamate synthase/dihydrofolate synthase [Clostridia bacterium]